MTPPPVKRIAGVVGLVGLAPTAVLLATGRITPVDAAVRAAWTFVAVLVLARLAGWGLHAVAGYFEEEEPGEEPIDVASPPPPTTAPPAAGPPAGEERRRTRRADPGDTTPEDAAEAS